MTQLWDFSGGIHPPEHKDFSTTRIKVVFQTLIAWE